MASLTFFIFYSAALLTLVLGALFYFLVMRPKNRALVSGSLDTTLWRVLVPRDEIPASGEEKQKEPKEIMVAMEQLYASLGVFKKSWLFRLRYGSPSITFEMALPHVGEEVIFYVALPRASADFFYDQLHSFFPSAKIEKSEDYNIFHPTGISAGAVAHLKKNTLLSLRTYEDLGKDPLEAIIGAFSQLKKVGEGAAIQFIVRPALHARYEQGKKAAQKIRGGVSPKEVLGGGLGYEFKKMTAPGKKKENKENARPGDEELAKHLESKASSLAFDVNIRLLASAATPEDTLSIMQSLESAFLQFNNPQGNEFSFTRLGGRTLEKMIYNFSFRLFNERESIYLSAHELASLLHFPYSGFSQPKVMYLRAREAPPPPNLPESGLRLGYNVFRGAQKDVYMLDDDRRRHLYAIGQTGTGKSTLLKEMARQDIVAGRGVCFIDPHGQDIESLMETIPESRMDDVIYFNPADVERPMGLNFLEYDARFPEQKTFIVNELLDIFRKLYGGVPESLGPMFEQYFRNSTMLVMEDPPS
ncbi:MAG: hypothetical protein HYT34_01800, partial [Candidatus Ryanbacteria bacterium]|nr:hypothetical protein [Candidatus Ryanbacteria bacterium]